MRRKLTTYSLAMDHEKGRPKAVMFERRLGITLAEVEHLAMEILRGVRRAPVTRSWLTPYGAQCQVRVPVQGVGLHRGRVTAVTTGWQLRYVEDRPRLVTAYIKGR